MRMLMICATIALGVSAGGATADEMVNVDGIEYPLSVLTANCQGMSDDPPAMIACFNALSALMEDKPAATKKDTVPVSQALDNLRAVAQFQNADTGLWIGGSDCNIHIVYFGNYFHISRRNVSTLDLFSVQFNVAKLKYDQISGVPGAQVPLSRAQVDVGATAVMRGGVGLDSAKHRFPSKSARSSMAEYASEVVGHLRPVEGQSFDFVLVHPARRQASGEIWKAFEVMAKACRGAAPSWAPKTN